jgi:light-regulated signal transduction histidine kinase (bacteriophytochrome)
MLVERYGPSLDEDGKRHLDVIESNALRMGQLIDDLLTFSRTGRTAMQFSRIDMNSPVGEVLEVLKAGHHGERLG